VRPRTRWGETQVQKEEPFIGQPVLSNESCRNCGTQLYAFPKWRAFDAGGWIEFDEACAYGCFPMTHLGVESL
jgi:hypothetical protein